jgi:putative membrane-bound dehydrogenase-like protein
MTNLNQDLTISDLLRISDFGIRILAGLMVTHLSVFAVPAAPQEPARTGPETEKRFPPLQVPAQFKATLFACDPLIEYPSVLALGPRSNSIFLAHDYMTGLGEKIVRRDEVRLVEDTDGDGYADKSTVWATNFNSIQGLACHDGRVFVMHSPLFTMLRDSNADGVADERRDLFTGLGWPPEKSNDRLHGANGVVAGHDGWLYLALGDRGCDVRRPEGDQLVLHGGGILRCRPDGSDLHVFSTGLRNIYDIALDEELNVFVRDNENDGGNYMIRVCHSFMGADHGYPYLYQEHPGEALSPLADLGRGSSAGGVAYLERAFPTAYQGVLFFCEWGRSVVIYPRERQGAGFVAMKESEFAAGAPNDPYGFRPTDIIVDRDGSLLVSDWADGQRPKRGRGRIYRIRAEPAASLPTNRGLDSESYQARMEAQSEIERRGRAGLTDLKRQLNRLGALGRFHAVWLIARAHDTKTLFAIAERDSDPRVRAQAVRAIGDLFDPVLVEHKLATTRSHPKIAERLATLARDHNAQVMLEVTVALGRLRWSKSPEWLRANLGTPDPTLTHAAIQTLRRSQNWPAVLEWLDAPDNSPLRPIALCALAGQPAAEVVDGLIRRIESSQEPTRRGEYAELLIRVHRKAGPWTYWGFRPGPRPPNTEPWERSRAIETVLDRTLADPDRNVRLAVLKQMEREKIPLRLETLTRWLRSEKESESVSAILSAMKGAPRETVRDVVDAVARESAHSISNRLAALEILSRESSESSKRLPIESNPDPGRQTKSAPERHTRLTQLALAGEGNAVRGREVFFNASKAGCTKCHRLGEQGQTLGPDLTGAGRRFSKIHIIESILEPSRAIAPAFRNLSVRLKNGEELTGVRVAETESLLTLGDAQSQAHAVKKDQIEDLRILELSIMPEGLESGLTDAEFVDLVEFLAGQK